MGIYFVQEEDGPIKVGVASDVIARLRGLQSGNCRELLIIAWLPDAPASEEKRTHSKLYDHRIRGEWFAPHEDVFLEMERLCALYPHDQTCVECDRLERRIMLGLDALPGGIERDAHSCGRVNRKAAA